MTTRTTITELLKKSFTELMKDVGTSIPGHILSFDPDRQIAQVQIGVQRVDRQGVKTDPPPLIEVPVFVYGGSQFSIDVQIDPGDEGVIIFSQRCIDAWVDTGGIANNPILRFHDIADAYFIPGVRSQPGKITGHNNNGVRIRNKSGSSDIWLKNDGNAEMNVGVLKVNGHIHSTGDMVSSFGDQDISQNTHTHGNVQTGSGNTGVPNDGS